MTERAAQLVLLALPVALVALALGTASGSGPARQTPDARPPEAPRLPALGEPLPRSSPALARRLTVATDSLLESIDAWRRDGNPSRGGPPDAVTRWALLEQRIYRLMAGRAGVGRRTIARLPRRLRARARDLTGAAQALGRLNTPVHPRRIHFRTGRPQPAGVLMRHYRKAQRRFGVSPNVLAAVNFVESAFGRLRNESTAGAQGPMQFIPATWRAYGMGGNIRDPHDAILGAANYLRASGAPGNYPRALFAYNRSSLYVEAVRRYARQMRGRGFLGLYSWQVFVRTTSGDRRLPAPPAK